MPDTEKLAARVPGRAIKYAAAHGALQALAEMGAPAPGHVDITHTITRSDEVDQGMRFAIIETFAREHDVAVFQGTNHVAACIEFDAEGVRTYYYLMAERDDMREL